MFGATTPGIVWEEVIEQGQAVLLDFRGIDSPEHKRFCLLWVYHSLLAYIRRRGPGRHTPLSLLIDELPYLVGSAGVSTDILTTDIDELINRIARSHAVWLTIAGQELFQLPEPLRQTVLAVGTVLLGRTSDHRTATELAERYYPFEPSCPYKIEKVYGVLEDAVPGTLFQSALPARHGVVDFRTEDVSREGQIALNSRRFLTLPRFAFLLGVSEQEGALPTTLQQITIEDLDKDQYPDTATLTKYRAEFMRAGGVSEQALLSEIAGRLPPSSGAPSPTPRPDRHHAPAGQPQPMAEAASAPATITHRSPRR